MRSPVCVYSRQGELAPARVRTLGRGTVLKGGGEGRGAREHVGAVSTNCHKLEKIE